MKRRSGFSIIEYPIVTLILGLVLLILALPSIFRGSHIGWLFGIAGGSLAILSGTVLCLLLWVERRL